MQYQDRIVIKIGTSVIVNEEGKLDIENFGYLIRAITGIKNKGYNIILVSSGAIAIGETRGNAGNRERSDSIRSKQAHATIGQGLLMGFYNEFFTDYGESAAQVLLSSDDIAQETKSKKVSEIIDILLDWGVVPVVNENDSVDSEEIESSDNSHIFGDNDMLAAKIAVLCNAGKLVILSDINGFYDRDPIKFSDAKIIEKIDSVDDMTFSKIVTERTAKRGYHGTKSKLKAAKYAMENHIDTIITNGKRPESLYDIVKGVKVGTLFSVKHS